MNQRHLKWVVIAFLGMWIVCFSYDSIFGIAWASDVYQRIFIWTPTVLIGLYWLVFGGKSKDKDGNDSK